MPQYRLPGFSKVQRNDIIVFNTPLGTEPLDLREYWIKRCIAIPGDVVRIDHKQLYVNDKLADTCDTIQYRYFMKTKRKLSSAFFEKNDIIVEKSAISHPDISIVSGHEGYIIYATPNKVKQLTTILPSYIQSVEPVEDEEIQPNNYPSSMLWDDTKGAMDPLTWHKGNFGLLVRTVLGWTKDNFGPLTVPKKGMSIHMDEKNILLYGHAIANFEGKKTIKFTQKECWIDGQQVKQYTFVKNYYFVMGDNRDQSKDSRFIGFIPEEHITGKAIMVLLSSRKKSLFSGIRWNRLFHMV
ncbi:signal peptidase I [Candidatus Cardinium hertigii]|uniref:Signal peptidase I n=1 Tax=Candidatus Cardinium hertigii TaxID=247481 RepID=A0A3N2QDN1_9BACT|nr:signal peptidase I [Candidatus Cardinium hertigii]